MHATALISEGAQRCTCCTPGETLRGATSFRLCEGNLVGKIVPFERATHAFRELRCAPFVAAEGLGHVPRSPCYVATAETRALGEISRLRILVPHFLACAQGTSERG